MKQLDGVSILVVEDDAIIAMLLEDMLEELGASLAGQARDVDTALELAGTAPFDCAILDLNLRGVPSYKVAEAIAGRNIPFVFATGYGEGDIDPRFAGVPILKKPFMMEDLATVIGAALERI